MDYPNLAEAIKEHRREIVAVRAADRTIAFVVRCATIIIRLLNWFNRILGGDK